MVLSMHTGDQSGMHENPDNEPIVPPARKSDVDRLPSIDAKNLLPAGDDSDFEAVCEFVEAVLPNSESPTAGQDGTDLRQSVCAAWADCREALSTPAAD